MDWSNERYSRLYCRDTPDLLAIGPEGRAVWYEMLRHADRTGVVQADRGDPPELLAELLRCRVDDVVIGLPKILERRMAQWGPFGLAMPNYVPANETPMSPSMRTREYRDRKRVERRDEALRVDETSQVVDKRSQNGDEVKRRVTDGDSVPCRAVPCRAEDNVEDEPRHRASGLAELAIEYLNAKTGGSRKVGKAVLEQFRQIAKDGYTEVEVRAVVDAKLAEWGKDETMAKFLRPSALFRPSNFRRYVDDIDGAPTGKQSSQPSLEWEAWQESRGGKPPT